MFYRDGILAVTDDNAENTLSLAPVDRELTIGSNTAGGQASPGFADDFRAYDRALLPPKIEILAGIA